MARWLLITIFSIFLSISLVSAMSIDFFYSDGCPYCQKIKPLVEEIDNQGVIVNYFNTANPEAQDFFIEKGFTGVPAFVIHTNYCEEITFTGAREQKLKCEVQEMSTKDCPTLSADHSIKGESWFLV